MNERLLTTDERDKLCNAHLYEVEKIIEAQDAKTSKLVAQEIFNEIEQLAQEMFAEVRKKGSYDWDSPIGINQTTTEKWQALKAKYNGEGGKEN